MFHNHHINLSLEIGIFIYIYTESRFIACYELLTSKHKTVQKSIIIF